MENNQTQFLADILARIQSMQKELINLENLVTEQLWRNLSNTEDGALEEDLPLDEESDEEDDLPFDFSSDSEDDLPFAADEDVEDDLPEAVTETSPEAATEVDTEAEATTDVVTEAEATNIVGVEPEVDAETVSEATTDVVTEADLEVSAKANTETVTEASSEATAEVPFELKIDEEFEVIPLGESFAPAKTAVMDKMAEKESWRTDIPGAKVSDIRSAISLNDRILFINTLFHEDPIAFKDALSQLNAKQSFEEGAAYILGLHPEWNHSSDVVYRFMMAVRRKLK